jgi:hypothetical protein
MMADYRLTTPWRWETWGARDEFTPYSRLAGRPVTGGTSTGTINPYITDIPRGYSLLVNGTTVTKIQTPSQDQLAAASYYFLGGHEYTVSQAQADVLTNAGYGDYLTVIP